MAKILKILIVEDEIALLDLYEEVLKDAGFNVKKCCNGRDALSLLSKGNYDLVLLDLMMPEVDGIEVLKVVRSDPDKYGTPKIIILTNLSSDVTIKESFDSKADGYLMKTELTPNQIVEEVRSFLIK